MDRFLDERRRESGPNRAMEMGLQFCFSGTVEEREASFAARVEKAKSSCHKTGVCVRMRISDPFVR